MKQARTALLLIPVLLLLALFFFHDRSSPPAVRAAALVGETAPPALKQAALAEDETPLEVRAVAAPAQMVPEPKPLPTTPERSRRARVQKNPGYLFGTVVAVDEQGTGWADQDGKFSLFVSWKRGARSYPVQIESGRWQVEVEKYDEIEELLIDSLSIDGRQLKVLEPLGDFALPAGGEIAIRTFLSAPAILRVVDRANQLDLSEVTLVAVRPQHIGFYDYPGKDWPERVIARDLASPIAIDELLSKFPRDPFSYPRGTKRFFVGATGYAWKAVTADFQVGGTTSFSLTKEATLEIQVSGVDPASGTLLRIRAAGKNPLLLAEIPLDHDGPLEITQLAHGERTVFAEIGNTWEQPLVLGSKRVQLLPGGRSYAALTLDSAPQSERADIGGVIRIAKEWGRERIMLIAEYQGTAIGDFDDHLIVHPELTESSSELFDHFAWQLPDLQVGQYVFTLYELPFRTVADVPAAGLENLEWTLPAPVELTIDLIDSTTGLPIRTDNLKWAPYQPGGRALYTGEEAGYDKAEQRYRILSPEIKIDLTVYQSDYVPLLETVDLSQGVRHHVMQLRPSSVIRLSMEANEIPIPFPKGWNRRPLGDKHKLCFRATPDSFKPEISMREPGLYRFEPPQVSGYRVPETIEVQALQGEITSHVIQLERE